LSYRSARLGIDFWAPLRVYKYGLSSRIPNLLLAKKHAFIDVRCTKNA
jgi:hypothetical protein